MTQLILIALYRTTFSPLIIFSFLFAIAMLGNKIQHKAFQVIAIILALGVTAVPTFYWFTPGSMTMFNLAVAFILTATLYILNFAKLTVLDYTVLLSSFSFIVRFIGRGSLSAPYFGTALSALCVFITILAVYKIRIGQLKGNLFYCWFACILAFIKGRIAGFLFKQYIVRLGQLQDSKIEALLVWGVALFIIIAISIGIIYGIKMIFKRHFDNINRMGKAYPQIERFFIYSSVVIFVIMGLFYYGDVAINGWQKPFLQILDSFLLFIMILQLSFLIMVFRITWLKDSLKNKTMENQSLAAYSSNLEKNMHDIKHIKHDIKNIFLTMGNFVEQSGNAAMKDFYREKISPFASDEIAKSDLYGKLAGLGNEQLKAFMYYKVSQGIERGINIELDVAVRHLSFTAQRGLELIDLVRILGILLDNAIEECMEIPGSSIHVKVSSNDDMTSYMIKNTLRSEIKEKGIRPGVSTKGKDRGKGLVTVRGIIERYDFIALNSYFHENRFVQNLVIYT